MQKDWPGDSRSDDNVGSFALKHRLKTKPGADGTQIIHGKFGLSLPKELNCDGENLLRAPGFSKSTHGTSANVG